MAIYFKMMEIISSFRYQSPPLHGDGLKLNISESDNSQEIFLLQEKLNIFD